MMFKKFAALCLVLCLVCGTVAFAEDHKITNEGEQTANTTVTYTVALNEQYTVTIPSSVTLSVNGEAPLELIIDPADEYNKLNGKIEIRLANVGGPFKMYRDGDTNNESIEFFLTHNLSDELDAAINNSFNLSPQALLSWKYKPGDTNSVNTTVYVRALVANVNVAGNYTGTMTFEVTTNDTTTPETPTNP